MDFNIALSQGLPSVSSSHEVEQTRLNDRGKMDALVLDRTDLCDLPLRGVCICVNSEAQLAVDFFPWRLMDELRMNG